MALLDGKMTLSPSNIISDIPVILKHTKITIKTLKSLNEGVMIDCVILNTLLYLYFYQLLSFFLLTLLITHHSSPYPIDGGYIGSA